MTDATTETGEPDREEAEAPRTKPVSDLSDLPTVRQYLNRRGAKPRSMLTAVVQEQRGRYWRDLATIRLDIETGEIEVKVGGAGDPAEYAPSADEAARIKAECAEAIWPEAVTLQAGRDGMPPHLPTALKDVDPERIFAFHDEEGRVVMLQLRATDADELEGRPKYTPWSYWSDNRWRQMEPGGALPLWGVPQLKRHTTVFIHEGAKAARAMARLVAEDATREDRARLDAHPWGKQLSSAAHLGWIGGALSPHRTDWSILKKMGATRAYIVADNDPPGVEAVPAISKQIRLPTFAILFTGEWPTGFDLGDEFPASMFKGKGDDRRYIGPDFFAMLAPATWATDVHKREKGGRLVPYLRDHFAKQWVYADEPELFVFADDPRIVRPADNLSKKLVKFSDSPGTSRLLLRDCEHVTTLAYSPDKPTGIVTVHDQRAFNVFRPSGVEPKRGEVKPFLDFMDYLFPVEKERAVVERWIATLIARPATRMHFGLLLVSKTQGVGKGILASQVLAPLVGDHNVGFPSEHDIVESAFNDWMAHKRLIVVGEIYQGQSFKAYNRMKGVITDKVFTVNKKHVAPYRIDNWCHVVACSNSEKALKIEASDRRWFYPQVAEVPWPKEKFAGFVSWLREGGLNIVAQWAAERGEYIETGDLPPMTPRKQVMIDESGAEELRWAREYCAGRIEDDESFVISTGQAYAYAKKEFGKIYNTKNDLGGAMLDAGMIKVVGPDGGEFALKYRSAYHRLFVSPAAILELEALDLGRKKEWLRNKLRETDHDLFDTM